MQTELKALFINTKGETKTKRNGENEAEAGCKPACLC